LNIIYTLVIYVIIIKFNFFRYDRKCKGIIKQENVIAIDDQASSLIIKQENITDIDDHVFNGVIEREFSNIIDYNYDSQLLQIA